MMLRRAQSIIAARGAHSGAGSWRATNGLGGVRILGLEGIEPYRLVYPLMAGLGNPNLKSHWANQMGKSSTGHGQLPYV